MQLARLAEEHPTLSEHATRLIDVLSRWDEALSPAPSASSWMHHHDFAARSKRLAEHLEAALTLSDHGRHQSALVVTRTALEHHVLDRLVLLADRYEEEITPEDPQLIDEWQIEWDEATEPWTRDVVSFERISKGRKVRLVRFGHPVVDDEGVEHERISPYWVAMERYDAFVGHPDRQSSTVRPFDDLEGRLARARRNQALYRGLFRWSSMCDNLALSELVEPREALELHVHYGFLSAFTHATQSGYGLERMSHLAGPPLDHALGELVLLYACTIAAAEVQTWSRYVTARPSLLDPLGASLLTLAADTRLTTSYFWFLGGAPQAYDRFQEANRRASPRLLAGLRPEVGPDDLVDAEVGYYDNPLERLRQLHTGGSEMATGFRFPAAWPTLRW